MYPGGMTGAVPPVQEALDRVLRSECFRNAPSSRRLLSYLAERAAAGDADQLKEYTVGVDAFGKPNGYDPRQDSTVRIQVGRLRKRLFEYYETEGKDDPHLLVLPKGRFGLECQVRPLILEPPSDLEEPLAGVVDPVPAPAARGWKIAALSFAALFFLTAAWAFLTFRNAAGPTPLSPWSPELAELWQPFSETKRPLVVAVGNPLFLQFENKIMYREPSIDKWEDLMRSPNVAAFKSALGVAEGRPAYYYAAIGEVNAAFLLGSRLGPRMSSMSVVRSSQLPWQQMADSNVLYLGPPRFFGDRLGSLPLTLEIVESPGAFKNQHPRPGEQEYYPYRDSPGYFSEDGEAYVLVTRTAGPSGNSDILAFASNSTFARVGAVEAFTSPAFAGTMVANLRQGAPAIPRYFQVLLRVRYKGGVPTETTYVLSRPLTGP